MVLIDLHTHSNVSDGTDTPGELVRRASAAGLDVLAITDHDTAAGWAEAAEAAREVGIGLVPGLEISTKHDGRSVHLLAYLPDPDFPPLAAQLVQILHGRDDRLPAMLQQLRAAGLFLRESHVRDAAGPHGIVGRPHVADALVTAGYARDRADAFERWLDPGRPGFVVRYAPRTVEMLAVVAAAGGATVVAHPWARTSREVLGPDSLATLATAGLVGLEVDHQDHTEADRTALRSIADELGLVVTGSSDYHGAGKVDHELGCNGTSEEALGRLLEAARARASRAGRAVPPGVGLDAVGLAS